MKGFFHIDMRASLLKSLAFTFGVVLLATVIGCMPQRKYQVPQHELPDNFRTLDSIKKTNDSINGAVSDSVITDVHWRKFFKDSNLLNLIDQGLQHNFDVQVALKNIEIADLRFRQSKLNWMPSVSATLGDANYQYRSENFYSNPATNYYKESGETAPSTMYMYTVQNASAINVSWEIDIWGKIKSQKEAFRFAYLKTNEARKAIQTDLISRIAQGYYNLLLLNAQLEVAQENVKWSERTLKIAQLQYDAGKTTALAIQQTRSQMLISKALVPELRQQIALQENNLSFLTGSLPGEINVGQSKLTDMYYDNIFDAGIPIQLLKERPDVLAAELELRSKNALVGVAQASQYPNIRLNLAGGVNSMLARNWFDIPGSIFGAVIGTVTQPLFEKKRLKTNYKVAGIERDQAEIQFQRSLYLAMNEVSDALIILSNLEEQLEITEEQVATSKLTVFQSDLLFNSGFATYLEIINAQKVNLETELKLNRLKLNRLTARVRLYKALGGGWD